MRDSTNPWRGLIDHVRVWECPRGKHHHWIQTTDGEVCVRCGLIHKVSDFSVTEDKED